MSIARYLLIITILAALAFLVGMFAGGASADAHTSKSQWAHVRCEHTVRHKVLTHYWYGTGYKMHKTNVNCHMGRTRRATVRFAHHWSSVFYGIRTTLWIFKSRLWCWDKGYYYEHWNVRRNGRLSRSTRALVTDHHCMHGS